MSDTPHLLHLENGKLAADTPPPAVERMVSEAVAHRTIVLHFHGGLVPYSSGIEIAQRLSPVYAGAGAYPVFFVWESGLLESLKNNLSEIAGEAIFRMIWKRVSAIVERKQSQDALGRAAGVLPALDTAGSDDRIEQSLRVVDGADSVPALSAGEPSSRGLRDLTDFEKLSLEQELLRDPLLTLETLKIANGLRDPLEVRTEMARGGAFVRGSSATRMDPLALEQLVERPEPGARGVISMAKMVQAIVSIAARVISRMVRKRDHGWHATIVEEILRAFYVASAGGFIWSLMKKDTADAFQPDPSVYGGACLVEALARSIRSAALPRVILIGHSTGAIYISEFLAKADAILPASLTFGVILLAPASRFEKTAETLRAHAGRIRDLRVFAMNDTTERADRLVPVLYPHSLLYFVSGVTEGGEDVPLVGMQRFYDAAHFPPADFPDVEAVRQFLNAAPNRNVWAVTGGAPAGLNSTSQKHGDFDNDAVTLESVAAMIRAGF